MTEVLSDNFDKVLPEILQSISNARFIAIDTEFTALYLHDKNKPSLFDTGEERYAKHFKTVQHSIPIQVGLSIFQFNSLRNTYQAQTFTFYTWPKPIMSVNQLLQMQSSSFQFLSRCDFDYNKLIYKGIPFLNKNQEAQVLQDLHKTKWELDSTIELYIDEIMPSIENWFEKTEENADFVLDSLSKILKHDIDAWYHVRNYLQVRYKKRLWSKVNENNQLVLQKVSPATFDMLSKQNDIATNTLKAALGFTHVYRALVAAKKPMIGHNMLMDLLLLKSTFGENLPQSYKKFKQMLSEDFPYLIDTKCLSYKVNKALPRNLEWQKNTLQELYEYFTKGKGRSISVNLPLIKTNLTVDQKYYHHAGWDSYCTGTIFIHMAHYLVTKNLDLKSHKTRDIMSSEHFDACQPIVNQVNLIRSVNSHMNISGPDPKSRRPPWLVAISLNDDLDISQVSLALSSFGYVEVKPINNKRALISVPTRNNADAILEHFKQTEDFVVKKYSFLAHHRFAAHLQAATISFCLLATLKIALQFCKQS